MACMFYFARCINIIHAIIYHILLFYFYFVVIFVIIITTLICCCLFKQCNSGGDAAWKVDVGHVESTGNGSLLLGLQQSPSPAGWLPSNCNELVSSVDHLHIFQVWAELYLCGHVTSTYGFLVN